MLRYVIKRVLLVIPTLLLVIFVVFATINLSPTNPAQIMLGADATPEQVEALETQLGLNKPLLERYVTYVVNILKGDFGNSWFTGTPVFDELFAKLPYTFNLTIIGMAFAIAIGLPLGILCAIKQYSMFDRTVNVVVLIMAAMPNFVVGIGLMVLFGLVLEVPGLPISGFGSWKNYILPILTSLLVGCVGSIRMGRTMMIQTLKMDYIRTAKAKGANKRQIIMKHALRNAMFPLITQYGMSFAMALGGSVISEQLFGIPGIGAAILTAVSQKDVPMIMASTLFLSTIYCLAIILIDIINASLDPRIKAQLIAKG